MNGREIECMTTEGLQQLIDQTETRCESLRLRLEASDSNENGLELALVENRKLLSKYQARLALMKRASK